MTRLGLQRPELRRLRLITCRHTHPKRNSLWPRDGQTAPEAVYTRICLTLQIFSCGILTLYSDASASWRRIRIACASGRRSASNPGFTEHVLHSTMRMLLHLAAKDDWHGCRGNKFGVQPTSPVPMEHQPIFSAFSGRVIRRAWCLGDLRHSQLRCQLESPKCSRATGKPVIRLSSWRPNRNGRDPNHPSVTPALKMSTTQLEQHSRPMERFKLSQAGK